LNIWQLKTPMTFEMHFPANVYTSVVYKFKDKRSQYRIRKRNLKYQLCSIRMLNQMTIRKT